MKTHNTIRLRGTTADDALSVAVDRMISAVEAEPRHTPAPWTSFYADPNSTVARIVEVWNNHEKIADVQGHNDDREADCANARHIVKCVNSHDRLVADRKRLRGAALRAEIILRGLVADVPSVTESHLGYAAVEALRSISATLTEVGAA